MKRNLFTILICALLLCATAFSAVSCNKAPNTEVQGTENDQVGGTESEGGDTQLSDEELYRPAEKDYNRTLTFMCVSSLQMIWSMRLSSLWESIWWTILWTMPLLWKETGITTLRFPLVMLHGNMPWSPWIFNFRILSMKS